MKRLLVSVLLIAPGFVSTAVAADDGRPEADKRIHESALVLSEIMSAGDKAIPDDLLHRAQCVGIVPNLKRAGFIVGAKYGKGVVTCRTRDGAGWSGPATVRIEGGSIGLQIGAGETDVVFVVMNRGGEEKLMNDKFTIGGDASAMAGPVGRSTTAETDAMMKAEAIFQRREQTNSHLRESATRLGQATGEGWRRESSYGDSDLRRARRMRARVRECHVIRGMPKL